ncbi:uncharacterized protein LOC134659103 [Cydia amplana]|uniref:uncharacterized protein LOC134659103 n=1 Tax=Cydia amplana TaxID=1869771 RepID=UPI002FE55FAD
MVPLRRVDEGGWDAGGGGRKRVRLPDMERVKRNNRGVLTAEVAPLQATQQTPIEGSSNTSVIMDVDGETSVTSDGCLKIQEQVDMLQVVPVQNLFEMIPNTYTYSSTDDMKVSYKSSRILDWGLFPLSPSYLKERKLDFRRVLCTGRGPGWWLKGHLVVSDQQEPPPVAAIWSLRPRVRLLLPVSTVLRVTWWSATSRSRRRWLLYGR